MNSSSKTYKFLVTTVLCLTIVALIGISYAAFSQELTINGGATVSKSSWKIQFQNLQPVKKTGQAKEITPPSIESGDTKIGTYAVTLTAPGDSVSYQVTVKNAGSFNAKVSSLNVPTPTCQGTGTTAETDKANVCKHLEYKLTYADGNTINVNDALNSGDTRDLLLTLTYKGDITAAELPKDDVTITNLAVTLTYIQA